MLETDTLSETAQRARSAATVLATLGTDVRDSVLADLSDRIEHEADAVLQANAYDCADAESSGMDEAMIDRLRLTPARLAGIAADVRRIAALPDPVGEEFDARTLPNGLRLSRRRVPLWCHRRHLRVTTKRHDRRIGPLFKVRQRRDPQRRQRSETLE